MAEITSSKTRGGFLAPVVAVGAFLLSTAILDVVISAAREREMTSSKMATGSGSPATATIGDKIPPYTTTVEVWEWIINSNTHFTMELICISMLGLKLIHVSKTDPGHFSCYWDMGSQAKMKCQFSFNSHLVLTSYTYNQMSKKHQPNIRCVLGEHWVSIGWILTAVSENVCTMWILNLSGGVY